MYYLKIYEHFYDRRNDHTNERATGRNDQLCSPREAETREDEVLMVKEVLIV